MLGKIITGIIDAALRHLDFEFFACGPILKNALVLEAQS
jgi:hypothetical protein